MASLTFWSHRDDIDVGSVGQVISRKYFDLKNKERTGLSNEKRDILLHCGYITTLSNKKPEKLRGSLNELEYHLKQSSVLTVTKEWPYIRIAFKNGLLVSIQGDEDTNDVNKIVIDSFAHDKLGVEFKISDVVFSTYFYAFSGVQNGKSCLTVIMFSKRFATDHLSLISAWGPQVLRYDLPDTDQSKSMCVNANQLCVWWNTNSQPVRSDAFKDEESFNLILLHVNASSNMIRELCHYKTEHEILQVSFFNPKYLQSLEKCRKSGQLLLIRYEQSQGGLFRANIIEIQIPAPYTSFACSPDESLLLVSCGDRSVVKYDVETNKSELMELPFVINKIMWHPTGLYFAASSSTGLIQIRDFSMNNMTPFLTDNEASLDIKSFFYNESPKISDIHWLADNKIMLLMTNGPFAILSINANVLGNSPLVITRQFIQAGKVESALTLLQHLSWNTYDRQFIQGILELCNYLMTLPLNHDHMAQLHATLGLWFNKPNRPLSVTEQYSNLIGSLSRKFFHHLVRYQQLEVAYRLALDLGSPELFMDLHRLAHELEEGQLAAAALKRAKIIAEQTLAN